MNKEQSLLFALLICYYLFAFLLLINELTKCKCKILKNIAL